MDPGPPLRADVGTVAGAGWPDDRRPAFALGRPLALPRPHTPLSAEQPGGTTQRA